MISTTGLVEDIVADGIRFFRPTPTALTLDELIEHEPGVLAARPSQGPVSPRRRRSRGQCIEVRGEVLEISEGHLVCRSPRALAGFLESPEVHIVSHELERRLRSRHDREDLARLFEDDEPHHHGSPTGNLPSAAPSPSNFLTDDQFERLFPVQIERGELMAFPRLHRETVLMTRRSVSCDGGSLETSAAVFFQRDRGVLCFDGERCTRVRSLSRMPESLTAACASKGALVDRGGLDLGGLHLETRLVVRRKTRRALKPRTGSRTTLPPELRRPAYVKPTTAPLRVGPRTRVVISDALFGAVAGRTTRGVFLPEEPVVRSERGLESVEALAVLDFGQGGQLAGEGA